jgi:hypothetical protein
LGNPFVIDGTTNAGYPRLAYDRTTAEFLMVYTRIDTTYAQRIKDADSSLQGPPFTVASAPGDQHTPAVSRMDWPGNQFLVLWTDTRAGQEDGDVYGRWIELEPILGDDAPLSNELPSGGSSYYQAPAQANQWQAVGLRPAAGGDLDLQLADGPDYVNILASSLNGTGQADLVVMNGYQSGQAAYFPYVQHYSGDTFYRIEYAPRTAKITQNNNTAHEALTAESVARIFDVYALAGQPLNIQAVPGASDLGLALFDPAGGPHQALADAAVLADANGPGQAENLYYVPAQAGWYGLLVWKKDDTADSLSLSASGAGNPAGYTIFLPLIDN